MVTAVSLTWRVGLSSGDDRGLVFPEALVAPPCPSIGVGSRCDCLPPSLTGDYESVPTLLGLRYLPFNAHIFSNGWAWDQAFLIHFYLFFGRGTRAKP